MTPCSVDFSSADDEHASWCLLAPPDTLVPRLERGVGLRRRAMSSRRRNEATYVDEASAPSRLTRAIQAGNAHLVRRLLESAINADGSRIDPRNADSVTKKSSLIVAAEAGNLEMCRLLIEDFGVDNDTISRDADNNTVLHVAATNDLVDIATVYLEHFSFVVDWANSEGMTPLHFASQNGHEAMVNLLLDWEADVELPDGEGNTCLHYASGWGHLKVILLLIDRGCPIFAKNNSGFTASDHAFSFAIQSTLEEAGKAHLDAKRAAKHRKQKEKERSDSARSDRARPSVASNQSVSDRSANSRRPTLDLGALDPRIAGLANESNGPTRSASLPAVATLARAPGPGQSPSGSPRLAPTSRPGVQPSLSLNTALPRTNSDAVSPSPTKTSSAMTPSSSFSRLIPKPLQLTPNRTSSRARTDSSASLVPPSPTTPGMTDTQQTPTLGHRPSGLLKEAQTQAKEGLAAIGLGSRGRAESSSSEQSSIGGGSSSSWRLPGKQRTHS